MRLLFLRHGVADERRPGLRDFERRLTNEGRAEVRLVAKGLQRLNLALCTVLSSPYLRARETAEEVAEVLTPGEPPRLVPELGCGCTFGDLDRVLDEFEPSVRVILVGHEPDLSGMIQEITGGRVRMKKASAALVDLGGRELRWLMEAEHLAAIGRAA